MHYKSYKSILSAQNGMNIYRGCTHGCIYCDSRSRCYQMDHAFEDIEIKTDAPAMLREALLKKRKPCMIGTGSMSDPYIDLEMTLGHTRACLQVIADLGFGLAIQTKSSQILRDLDLLKAIHAKSKCVVQMTMTTYDDDLCRLIEPNVSTTRERFEALMILKQHGIPTVIWLSPFLPFINDTEENLEGLLDYCLQAEVRGILCFGIGLTLREGNREYFYEQLDRHFPGMKARYIKTFGNAYECRSPKSGTLMKRLTDVCKQHHILCDPRTVFSDLKTYESKEESRQLSMF